MIQLDACRCEDGFVLVADAHDLLDQDVWVTWVAGLWQHAEETQDPSFAPGEPLVLEPSRVTRATTTPSASGIATTP